MKNAATTQLKGLILSRSLLAGAAGMVPVPWLDELLAGMVRTQLVRRIAALRQVDLDANAAALLATPRGGRLLGAATLGAAALGATRRSFRRVAGALLLVRRADEALETFQVGTLFDHYCAHHHVGFGLDGAQAGRLRGAMDRAIRKARGEAVTAAFHRALRTAAGAARRLPRGLSALWSRRKGGARQMALAEPISPAELAALEAQLECAASSSFVKRALSAIDAELERSYLAVLTGAFDAAFRQGTHGPLRGAKGGLR